MAEGAHAPHPCDARNGAVHFRAQGDVAFLFSEMLDVAAKFRQADDVFRQGRVPFLLKDGLIQKILQQGMLASLQGTDEKGHVFSEAGRACAVCGLCLQGRVAERKRECGAFERGNVPAVRSPMT